MIADSNSTDIVYSNYFTGIHGNYLKPSIAKSGMDPDNLPVADPTKMDFDGATTGAKAWKDIWGAGQGIGAVKKVVPVSELVAGCRRNIKRPRAHADLRLNLNPFASLVADKTGVDDLLAFAPSSNEGMPFLPEISASMNRVALTGVGSSFTFLNFALMTSLPRQACSVESWPSVQTRSAPPVPCISRNESL